jgi:hypothetical protein
MVDDSARHGVGRTTGVQNPHAASLHTPGRTHVLPGSRSAQCICCVGSYKGEVRRGILAAVARVKEGDAQRALEQELLTSVELLEHAAHTSMAALLLVLCSTLLLEVPCA